MARVVFRPQLIEYLLANKGQVITMGELMKALPEGAQEASVRSCMRKMIEEGHFQIRTIAAGHAWSIDGLPAARQEVPGRHAAIDARARTVAHGAAIGPFVRLGEMADGSALVRDENDGALYTLKRL
jgi:hypothetical protein